MTNIKQKIKKLILILIFMIIFTLSLVFYSNLNPLIKHMLADEFDLVSSKDNMLVHFINVGQADASAINFPDGKVMLIDTGSKDSNSTYIKYLKENVVNTKMNNHIDYLVLSHADMDHIGGTMKLLKNFSIGTIYMPKIASDSNGYAEILNYVENKCKYVTLGEEFSIKNKLYHITFFEILNSTNTNDSSQIIKVEGFDKSFLFTGDVSSAVEHDYIERYGKELDIDVLKVAHHGSSSSSSDEFLKVTTPEYAVISVGFGNDYGHPSYDVLERLKINNVKTLRTDKKDDILFTIGDDYSFKPLTSVYFVTDMSLDYSVVVIVLDVSLLIVCVFIIFKKDKKKRNKR